MHTPRDPTGYGYQTNKERIVVETKAAATTQAYSNSNRLQIIIHRHELVHKRRIDVL